MAKTKENYLKKLETLRPNVKSITVTTILTPPQPPNSLATWECVIVNKAGKRYRGSSDDPEKAVSYALATMGAVEDLISVLG